MCKQAAEELLGYCLRGERWPGDLIGKLVGGACSNELFRVVVEGLADRFEPALCETYAGLFSDVLGHCFPEFDPKQLLERYHRIRASRRFTGAPERVEVVFVLSRVTLGADVAITSVILDAAKRRFPNAGIYFVGSRKGWELFAADPRIRHAEALYPRTGSLRERLEPWRALRALVDRPGSITIDPDSRLTQLGLLPVCPDTQYFFFESRAYGGNGGQPLGLLARQWVAETFGVEGARAYIAPEPAPTPAERPLVTISLGVGDNPAKRVVDPFEASLLQRLLERGAQIYIDQGAGEEEAGRVERAVAACPAASGRVHSWRGAFAPFASSIARSDLYIGYDSAGQHVAAAAAVPLVSVFAGAVNDRMFARWRPSGPGRIEVVRADGLAPGQTLAETLRAVDRLGIMG